MNREWRSCKLGDVLTLKRGYDLPNQQRRPGPFPVVSSSGVTDHHAEAKVTGPGVVTGRYGTLGQVFLIVGDFWPLNTSLYVSDFKGNDPRFVSYLLRTLNFATQNAAGAVPGVNRNHLHAMNVRVPDLAEQRRIADILSAYDDLIENCERRIRVLDEMARVLYREWFVLFRYPGHEKTPLVDSALGRIPKGWQSTFLGAFIDTGEAELQTGPFGTQLRASDYAEEGVPVINVRNIGYGAIRPNTLEHLAADQAEKHARHMLADGDIVFGRKGAVDRHVLVGKGEAGWIQGSDCIRLRLATSRITGRLLSFAFREATHKEWMLRHCSGAATMASLNQDVLRRIPVVVPPAGLIARFDEYASSALAATHSISSRIENLRNTRDLLLQRLLSGELSVEDAA
jgi:type I restriction enzyme S subunit